MRTLVAFVFFCAHALIAQSQGSYPPPKTPSERLARSAGTYLGSIEYLRAIKTSTECRSVLTAVVVPNFDNVMEKEILPAFNIAERNSIRNEFLAAKKQIAEEAGRQVSRILRESFSKNENHDTVCGMIAGTLGATVARSKDQWQTAHNTSK